MAKIKSSVSRKKVASKPAKVCETCKGTGLKSHTQLCPTCNGTPVASKKKK